MPNAQGWLWSETLGFFLGVSDGQLRYFSLEGSLLPTPQEAAQNEIFKANQEQQRANQEQQRAEQEFQRAEQEFQRAEQESQMARQAQAELQEFQEKIRSLGISLD